jgi:hypothetical protein
LQKATKLDAAKSTGASGGSKVESAPAASNVDTILLEIKCAGDEVRKLKAAKADKVESSVFVSE